MTESESLSHIFPFNSHEILICKKTIYITSLSFGTITSLDSRKLGQKEGKELEHALTEVLPACDACAYMCLGEEQGSVSHQTPSP